MDKMMMKKMMGKKKQEEMSDQEKDAKMSVLKDLKQQAAGAMGDKLKGFKKVSVMAPDQESLKKGLEKAEEIVEGQSEMGEMGEEEGEYDEEKEDMPDYSEMSEEELKMHKEMIDKCLAEKMKE